MLLKTIFKLKDKKQILENMIKQVYIFSFILHLFSLKFKLRLSRDFQINSKIKNLWWIRSISFFYKYFFNNTLYTKKRKEIKNIFIFMEKINQWKIFSLLDKKKQWGVLTVDSTYFPTNVRKYSNPWFGTEARRFGDD